MSSKMSILHKLIWMAVLFKVAHGLPHPENSADSNSTDLSKDSNETNYRLPTDVVPPHYIMKFVTNLNVNISPYKVESNINITVLAENKNTITLHAFNLKFDEVYTSLVDLTNQTIRPVVHMIDNDSIERTTSTKWVIKFLPSDPAQVQQPILFCTAHIHWDPEYCDVKLIQTMMLSNELRTILVQAGHSFRPGHKPDSSNVQLLLCGDFNSLPDSGVIEFLTSGRVASDHRDFKELAYKSCLQKISGCDKSNEFIHSFKLASAYGEDIMPYTNFTFDFKGIIDYVFYSKQSMVPLGLLGPISADWFKEHKIVGCPHPHIPSDHFPLLVELEMIPTVGTSNGLISRR